MKKYFFILFLITVSIKNLYSEGNFIKILSSNSSYQIASTYSEIFGQTTVFRGPVVELMGSGKAVQEFCDSKDYNVMFISREIKKIELQKCKAKNTGDILEIIVGHIPLVLVNSIYAPDFSLTYQDIYKALIKNIYLNGKIILNNNNFWNEVSHKLPKIPIKFYGPSAGSGTRDIFVNEVIMPKCLIDEDLNKLSKVLYKNNEKICTSVRSDEHYIDHGDDYMSLIKKINLDQNIVALVDYYIYTQNLDKIKAIKINNVDIVDTDVIESGQYTMSLPIIMYVKKNIYNNSDYIKLFVKNIISEKSISKTGYLTEIGLFNNHTEQKIIKL